MATVENSWSDWLDFTKEKVDTVPDSPGVYMMHASMKVLFINNADNLKKSLEDALVMPCVSEATRFRFMPTEDHNEIKDELLSDYKNRHDGKFPKCMNQN